MQFLGNLGIDIKLLIAQLINFGLLLWLLTKFLYKPIINKIEEDEATLEKAESQSKLLEQQKQDFAAQKNKEISDTKKRAQEILNEADKVAKEIKEKAQNDTELEKQAVIKQIKSRLSTIENDNKE